MFYILLIFLLLLGIFAAITVVQNFGTLLSTNVHLTVLVWHLPGIPVLLLCLLGALLGALVLYVVAMRSARRDVQAMKVLRTRIEELEKSSDRSSSGSLAATFAPSVVPIPGFASGGPMGPGKGPGSTSPGPVGPGPIGPGPVGPGSGGPGPIGPGPVGPGPMGPGSIGQWQPPSNSVQNISPSASGNNLAVPPRLFPQKPQSQPQQQQQMGAPRPPFQHP